MPSYEAPELVRALVMEVAKARSKQRGGRGYWTQWESDHPSEAVTLPITYHLDSCPCEAVNHWRREETPCSKRCQEHMKLLELAAVYLKCDVRDFYPKKLREKMK